MAYWDGTRWLEDVPAATTPPSRRRRLLGAGAEAALITTLVFGLIAGTTLAAKGGNGKGPGHGGGNGKHSNGTSEIVLVMVDDANGDGLPNWADTVTFDISTTATDSPYLTLECYQSGALVYSAWAGFYPDYPWPGSQLMPLSSPSWTGGAADCVATLNQDLATLAFRANG